MTVTYVGSLTIGETIPAGATAINAALPDLQARLEAMASFAPTTGSFASSLADAQATVGAIQAVISAGITLPDMGAQFAAAAAEVAELEATLALALTFVDALGVGGVHVYRYSGDAADLGGEFSAELATGFPGGAGTDHTDGLLIATTIPATWAALASVFQVVPP